jgi:UDP-glucose 4-epimerase
MRILVTGGLGFLGGRIARHLLDEGHDVLVGTRRDIKSEEYPNQDAKVVQTCWHDTAKLEDICSGVDVIIHASGMNAQDCVRDPVGALHVNTLAPASILQAAIKTRVRRFIYISTIHVYTDCLQGVISEACCPSNLHPYATSIRAAEDVVLCAQKSRRIDGIVIRLSNGYGVPIHHTVNCWMLLVPSLCRQAVETRRMVLASDGLQVRNFIPLQEICNVMDFLACRISLQRNVGEVGAINVGGKTTLTVLEMAKRVQSRCRSVLGFTPELVVGPRGNLSQSLELDFRIDRFLSLGYVHVYNPNEEIDRLLIYCHDIFSGS